MRAPHRRRSCPASANPWIGTFHAICARLLRRHAEALGSIRSFVIYDDTDQRAMLTRVVRDLGIDERRYPPRELAPLHRAAEAEARSSRTRSRCATRTTRSAQRVYAHLRSSACSSRGALDFNDLLVRMVYGMRSSEALRFDAAAQVAVHPGRRVPGHQPRAARAGAHAVRARTATCAWSATTISPSTGGAAPTGATSSTSAARSPTRTVVKLEQNYRSTAHILGAAMAVIAQEPRARAQDAVDREPRRARRCASITCADERDEARAIVEAVRSLRDDGIRLAADGDLLSHPRPEPRARRGDARRRTWPTAWSAASASTSAPR